MIALNDAGGSKPKKITPRCDICGQSAKGGVTYSFYGLPDTRACMSCLVKAAQGIMQKMAKPKQKGPGDCD